MENSELRKTLQHGLAIPAHPLALTAERRLDERRQRALTRYYLAAGVGGLAVGVHTTQFAIRDPKIGLFEPVLALAAEEMNRAARPLVRIGGVCGDDEASDERGSRRCASSAITPGCSVSPRCPMRRRPSCSRIAATVAAVIPVVGFYLQPAVGGRALPYSFWRQFAEIENVVAIKIAPFNRYQTFDVVRAVAESGRDDLALYTGNDDNIVPDLLTPFRVGGKTLRIVGGLLGHWSVWAKRAVELLAECRSATASPEWLQRGVEVTDSNAAFFDAANGFHGCIAGLHEVLRRQGLLEGIWCLDPHEAPARAKPRKLTGSIAPTRT